MEVKSIRTFSISETDIKAIVAEHLTRTQGVKVTAGDVVIHIKDSTPYGGQFDEGNPAVLTITAAIDGTPPADVRPLVPSDWRKPRR